MNIAQTRCNYNNIINDLGKDLVTSICRELESGWRLQFVFDNFDFKILANIILKNHKNSDMHWIGQFVTFNRISNEHLDDEKPLIDDPALFTNANYLLSASDLEKILDYYTVLAARILIEFLPCLMPLAKVIPKHIKHM